MEIKNLTELPPARHQTMVVKEKEGEPWERRAAIITTEEQA